MRFRGCASLFLLASCATSLPPRGQLAIKPFGFEVADFTLPSGLRIYLQEDHSAPIAGIVTLVGAGSTSDPAGKEGLAHFVEHLAYRSKPLDDSDTTMWDLLDQRGATFLNGETEFDSTVYYEYGPNQALPGLMRLALARLNDPIHRVDERALELERDIIRNELRERGEWTQHGGIFGWIQNALFTPANPYHHSVGGAENSLAAIDLGDIKGFVARHYRPDNVTMFVIGDVRTEEVRQLLSKTLTAALAGDEAHPVAHRGARLGEPAPEPPALPERSARIEEHEANVSLPELWIAWSLPGGLRASSTMLDFITLALNAYAYGAVWTDPDVLTVHASVHEGANGSVLLCIAKLAEGAHPEESATHILNQVAWLWLPQDHTHREKNAAATFFLDLQRMAALGLVLEAENITARARRLVAYAHFAGDTHAYSNRIHGIVTMESSPVGDFANRYLSRDRARIVLVRPLEHEPIASFGRPSAAAPQPLQAFGFDDNAPSGSVPPMQSLVKTVRLANGVEVLIVKRGIIPVVPVKLLLRAGSGDATPRGALDLADYVTRVGSHEHGRLVDFGARSYEHVSTDSTTFELHAASGNLPNLLAMLSDRVTSLDVSSVAADRFRKDAAPVLSRMEARPESRASRAFWQALLAPHPYSQQATSADLVRIGDRDVEVTLASTYNPKRAVVAIVGDVEPAEAEREARKWLEQWSPPKNARELAVPPPLCDGNCSQDTGPKRLVVTPLAGTSQVEISFGCALPEPDARTAAIHRVAATMIGDHLYDAITRELGASYGMHGGATPLRGAGGVLVIDGNIEEAKLAAALSIIRKYWDGLPAGRFEEREVLRARAKDGRELAFHFATSSQLADFLLEERNLGRDIYAIDHYPAEIASITKQDVQNALSACHDRAAVSLVGNEGVIRAALRTAGWR